jgi:hypothetical protein
VADAYWFRQFQREMLSFQDNPAPVESVRGDGTGLAIPAHGEALAVAGAAFLTDVSISRTFSANRARACSRLRSEPRQVAQNLTPTRRPQVAGALQVLPIPRVLASTWVR